MLEEEKNRYMNVKIDATTTVRDAGGVQFVSYLLNKVNGMNGMDPRVLEITALAGGYPGRNLTDENKINWLQKLEALGIEL
jgi:hypothetical protein